MSCMHYWSQDRAPIHRLPSLTLLPVLDHRLEQLASECSGQRDGNSVADQPVVFLRGIGVVPSPQLIAVGDSLGALSFETGEDSVLGRVDADAVTICRLHPLPLTRVSNKLRCHEARLAVMMVGKTPSVSRRSKLPGR